MSSKKTKTAGDATGSNKVSSSFKWTPELDMKLFSLMTIPRQVGAKEHAEFATALGVPTPGGVRNRVAKIKSDYRKAYEECGIAMPGGPAVSGKTDHPKPKTPAASQGGKKRAAKEMSSDDDEHFGGAGKKTAKKAKKVEEYDIELEGGFDGIKIEEYYEEI